MMKASSSLVCQDVLGRDWIGLHIPISLGPQSFLSWEGHDLRRGCSAAEADPEGTPLRW